MDKGICINYLKDMLKVELKLYNKDIPENLPAYFKREYDLYMGKIQEVNCIVIFSKNDSIISIKRLKKRFEMISEAITRDEPLIYVSEELDWYNREQMINNGISFIVPQKQIYLPFLGQILTSNFGPTGIKREYLSPSAQAIFIEIVGGDNQEYAISDFDYMGLSKMSVSRALNEIADLKFIKKKAVGRNIVWELMRPRKETWYSAKKYLSNPILKTLFIKDNVMHDDFENALVAGEEALSQISLISSPRKSVIALYNKDYSKIKVRFTMVSSRVEEAIELQIWKHQIPKVENIIHPLALALSFVGNNDERIEESIHRILEEYWTEVANGSRT